MVEPSNPRAPAGFKFLEVFITLPAECPKMYDKLKQMRDRLTSHKHLIDRTTPFNPGAYDLYFKVYENMNHPAVVAIRYLADKGEKQVIGELITICVPEKVRVDWDPMMPVREKPEDDRNYVRYGNLWFNEDFLICYNAVLSMVNGLLEGEERVQEKEARRRFQNPDPYYPSEHPEWKFFKKESSSDEGDEKPARLRW
ncbi:hypothetical protein BDV38DRAFT_276827 [Aspergillus pseudotamarii]|uniref:Uncharacterized protein n=1 Tax=Aspergillus pseudotamarii TaxID=132259 RepID=A0A5N6TC60_ASPPS|nr:uncharacterized protein BDV38DRAFT_276827 [Aspergillus pseudotamarii]KAE8143749.1 hypothetical protein BDV38DRAFT_276827 [Aspergillus pseudotamarii]